MKHLMVATDGSASADRAVDEAARMAKQSGADLLIAHVIGGYGLPGTVLERFTLPEHTWFDELLDTYSAQVLTQAKARAQALGVPDARLASYRGEIVPAILQAAQQQHIDAIVVGRRGTGHMSSLLLGSTAQKLVSLSPCVVTVVP